MKSKMKTKEQVLDKYFPKGSKKRGEAMACIVVAYLEGKDKSHQEELNFLKRELLGKFHKITNYDKLITKRIKELENEQHLEKHI